MLRGGSEMPQHKISELSTDTLQDAFRNIPPDATELNLSGNDLSKIPVADLVAALKSLPPTIQSLNLSNTSLAKIDNTDLQQILAAIVFAGNLNLAKNGLSSRETGLLEQTFRSIRRNVVSLGLADNDLFCGRPIDDLPRVFGTLHDGLNSLDLSGNSLREHDDDQITKIFSSFPRQLESLILAGTGPTYENATSAGLSRAFSNLPQGIRSLDLSGYLDIPFAEIAAESTKLPSIVKIKLSATQVTSMSPEDCKGLLTIFPGIKTPANVEFSRLKTETTTDNALAFKLGIRLPSTLKSIGAAYIKEELRAGRMAESDRENLPDAVSRALDESPTRPK